jgi:hypothetical protein
MTGTSMGCCNRPAVTTTATDSDTEIAAGVLALVGASAMSSRELSEWIEDATCAHDYRGVPQPERVALSVALLEARLAPQSKWRTVLETCVTAATGAGA